MRTFRLAHGLVRCNINAGVQARSERMCHSEMSKQKSQRGIETRGCGWRHAPEAWAEIWEKAGSWVPASERVSWDSGLGEARRLCALRVPRVIWVESWRCKSSQHRKTVCVCLSLSLSLSSSCRITFNSKVIKSFVPELRSRKVLYFGFLYCLWTFYEHYVYFTYPYHGYVTLAQEYKARHDWVGKVIHWEMCRKFQFDHTNKWYMHNPAPVLENDSHKLQWDFNIQTDQLIPARRPDLTIINKKKKENQQNCRLCCPGGPQNKSERKWKER